MKLPNAIKNHRRDDENFSRLESTVNRCLTTVQTRMSQTMNKTNDLDYYLFLHDLINSLFT